MLAGGQCAFSLANVAALLPIQPMDDSGEGGYAETGLSEGPGGINGLGPQKSLDQVDEFGGREGEKISEWQAGWNVTNAIQVREPSLSIHTAFSFSPLLKRGEGAPRET